MKTQRTLIENININYKTRQISVWLWYDRILFLYATCALKMMMMMISSALKTVAYLDQYHIAIYQGFFPYLPGYASFRQEPTSRQKDEPNFSSNPRLQQNYNSIVLGSSLGLFCPGKREEPEHQSQASAGHVAHAAWHYNSAFRAASRPIESCL